MGINSANVSQKNDTKNDNIKENILIQPKVNPTASLDDLEGAKLRKKSEASTKSGNTIKSGSSASSNEGCKLAIIHHSRQVYEKKEIRNHEKSRLVNKPTLDCELQIKTLLDCRLVNISYGINCIRLQDYVVDNKQKSIIESKPHIDKYHTCYLCYKDGNLVYNKVKESKLGSIYSKSLNLALKKLYSSRIEKNEKHYTYSYSSIDLSEKASFKNNYGFFENQENLFYYNSKSECDSNNSIDTNITENEIKIEFESNFRETSSKKSEFNNNFKSSNTKVEAKKDEIRNKYFTSLFSKNVWNKANSHNNIIILDWDDTLLCTSFLTPLGYFQENMYVAPEDVIKIKILEKYVFTLLEKCVNQADTFIVTNASTQWIEYSSNKFYPSITSLLQNINIISARETCEKVYPGNQRKWKLETFKLIVDKFKRDIITNIVCIGDSFIEMEAGHVIASQFKKAFIKSVKFKEAPKLEELVKQLKLLTSQFDYIFSSPKSLTVTVERKAKEKERENKLS